MNQEGAIHNVSGVVLDIHAVHKKAKKHEGRKIQSTKDSVKRVENDSESSDILASEDLLWIKMLRHSRISDEEIREIVTEWMMLLKKIKEVSTII